MVGRQFLHVCALVSCMAASTLQSEQYCEADNTGRCHQSECHTKGTINLTCPSSKPNAIITINVIFLALQNRSGHSCSEECCSPVSADRDCQVPLLTSHSYHRNATALCNSKSQCQLNTFTQRQLYCNYTRLNNYVRVHYTCNSQLTSPTTTTPTATKAASPVIGASDEFKRNNSTNNTTTHSAAALPTASVMSTAAASNVRQWWDALWPSQTSLRDVITGAIVAVLMLIIIILTAVICTRRNKSHGNVNTTSPGGVQRGRAYSLSNFYDQPTTLLTDPCSPMSPVSPVYSTISGADVLDSDSPTGYKHNQLYHPMQKQVISHNSRQVPDTYIFQDEAFVDDSLPTPPPLPHSATLQTRDGADYLLPMTSHAPRHSAANLASSSATTAAAIAARIRLDSSRSSGSQLNQTDTVDYVDGACYTDTRLMQFTGRQLSSDLLVNARRRKQPVPPYRPASMQILHTGHGGASFDYTPEPQQYEEIPADFVTLPNRQMENNMRYRPPAPPPVVTPPIAPPTKILFANRLSSQPSRGRRQCGSVDDALLATIDKLSIDQWAESTIPRDEEPSSEDTPIIETENEQAVISMTRKGSYEEDDVILIESTIYG